MMRAF